MKVLQSNYQKMLINRHVKKQESQKYEPGVQDLESAI